jgi:hypothetical protein
MSTIAAKFSTATTRVKVGTAVVAFAAATTLTPAIAEATPGFAPIAQSVGSSTVDLSTLPVLPTGLNAVIEADASATAVAGPISTVIVGIASIPLVALSWAADTAYTFGNLLGGTNTFIGSALLAAGDSVYAALENIHFGPYNTAE